MKYKITHTTLYTYGEAVPVCHNLLHLTPREGHGQTCRHHKLIIRPHPTSIGRRSDTFGNLVHFFSVEQAHKRLRVTSISRTEISGPQIPDPAATPPWESVRDHLHQKVEPAWLEAVQFAFDSPAVVTFEALADYARTSFPAGRPILEAALDLTRRIHDDFKFDPTATEVGSSLSEIFVLRRGVCQDFAHLQIGCLRSLGLAARYVSGYLRTRPPPGKPRLVGVDASHAWVSVFCGNAGWVDADPTNNVIPSVDHVTIAWGRDYHDVSPIKGVVIGGSQHTLRVAVDVMPLEDDPPAS